MITPRLQQALQRLDELAPQQQDAIAHMIEEQLAPATILPNYAGSMPDLPDDFEEELMRRRHASPPSPPVDDELQSLLGDDAE